MPQYVVRRNKKDDQIVFGAAARAIPRQPVGAVTAKMSSSGNAYNLDLIQTDIGEDTGAEYKLLFDIPFTEFRTRVWNGDRTALQAKVSYGTTTATINGINLVTEFQTADNAVGNVGIGTTRADNVILNFGEDNDLQIWHDGSDSNIADKGTGNLHISSQDFTVMWNPGKTIKRAVFGDYNCSFFYGNQERLKVVGYGVTLTGTLNATGGIKASGIVTASSFVGDGSGLTGIVASGSGVVIKHDGATVGTAGTINFSTNLDVSAISAGIVTITASGSGGGGGVSNVVEDTTPQLGGDLDVNGKDIVSTSNGNIEFTPNGTGKVVFKGVTGNGGNGAGRIVLNCEVNSHGVTIQGPPHSAGATYTLTLPDTDGSANQVLKTDGSGGLDWVDQPSVTGIAYTSLSGIPVATLTVNQFEYYQQYATPGGGSATPGPQISTVEPDYNKNPFYYGTQLKPGQEMRWTHHSDSSTEKYGLGMWGGSTSYTPSNGFHTSLWSRIARFDHNIVDFGTSSFDSKGFVPSAGTNVNYTISTSTELSLAYNKYTNKLEVHNVTGGNREIIAIASTAEDGNPKTISFAISNAGALPGITTVTDYEYPADWYVGYGATSNQLLSNPFSTGAKRDLHPVYWPQRLEPGYEYRFNSLNTSTAEHFYTLGIWSGDTDAAYGGRSYNVLNWDTCFSIATDAVNNFLNPSGADNWLNSGDDNASKNTTVATATSVTFNKGDVLCLNYNPTDGKLRIINETTGYVALGTSNNAFTDSQIIFMGGKQALVDAPSFTKRDQSWEKIAYRYTTGINWKWREDGTDLSYVNMSATRDILPGQRVEFRIPSSGFNHYYWIAAGGWQGPTGLSANTFSAAINVDAGSDLYWRWDTGEDTNVSNGWTFNTANSKYDSGQGDWDGGNSYEHHMQYRYRTSDNKVEWWDVTPDNASAPERIATSTNTLGGGAIRMGIMSIQNDIRTSGTHIDLKELTYTVN